MNRSIAVRIASLIVSNSPFFTSDCRLWIFSGGMRIVTRSDSGGMAAWPRCQTNMAISSDKRMASPVLKDVPAPRPPLEGGAPSHPSLNVVRSEVEVVREAVEPTDRVDPRATLWLSGRPFALELEERVRERAILIRDVAHDHLRETGQPHLDARLFLDLASHAGFRGLAGLGHPA